MMGSVHTTSQSSSVPVRDGLAVVLATVVLVPAVNVLAWLSLRSNSPSRSVVACQFDLNDNHAESVHARHEYRSSEHDSKPTGTEDDREVVCTELIMRL